MMQFCGAVVVHSLSGEKVYNRDEAITLGDLKSNIAQEKGLESWQVGFALGGVKLTDPAEVIPADTELNLVINKSFEEFIRYYTADLAGTNILLRCTKTENHKMQVRIVALLDAMSLKEARFIAEHNFAFPPDLQEILIDRCYECVGFEGTSHDRHSRFMQDIAQFLKSDSFCGPTHPNGQFRIVCRIRGEQKFGAILDRYAQPETT